MKIRVSTISGFASISAVVLAGMLIGGCSSPEVLKERPFIPAPSSSDDVVIDKVTEEKIDIDIAMPDTPPAINAQPSDFPPLGPVKAKALTYKVRKGDNFWSIARRFRVSKEELAAYNNLSLKKPLYVGKVLNIPPGGYAAPGDKLSPVKRPASRRSVSTRRTRGKAIPAGGKYTVKRGDTLGGIAHRFGVKTRALAQANNISKPYLIRVGQKLVIPEGAVKIKSTPAPRPVQKKAPVDSIDNALNGITIEPQPSPAKKPAIKDQSPEDILNSINVGGEKSEAAILDGLDLGSAKTRNIGVKNDTTIQQFAAENGVSVNDVKRYNPDFTDGKIPKGSIVVVPQ